MIDSRLRFQLFDHLDTPLNVGNNFMKLGLRVVHFEAAGKDFDQVLGCLLLIACKLVLLVDDVELFN